MTCSLEFLPAANVSEDFAGLLATVRQHASASMALPQYMFADVTSSRLLMRVQNHAAEATFRDLLDIAAKYVLDAYAHHQRVHGLRIARRKVIAMTDSIRDRRVRRRARRLIGRMFDAAGGTR